MNFKKISFLMICMLFSLFSINAQEVVTLEQAKAQKAKVDTEIETLKANLDALEKESNTLKTDIEKLSGWMTGFGGTVGFGFNKNDNWTGSPNPTSSSSRLALGLSAYANNIKEKTLWRNSVILAKEWQDLDLDDEGEDDDLFDNGTVDILNISSMGGYRFSKVLAATALGELNTSLGNFLEPGTADIGVGVTWTPDDHFILVVHPLNYHFAFSGFDDVESNSSLGAKLRAEYNNKFMFLGQSISLASTLTSFIPYSGDEELIDPMQVGVEPWEATPFEYTWINNLSFNFWKGIGVGVGFGLRQADRESLDLQKYYSIGLNYAL